MCRTAWLRLPRAASPSPLNCSIAPLTWIHRSRVACGSAASASVRAGNVIATVSSNRDDARKISQAITAMPLRRCASRLAATAWLNVHAVSSGRGAKPQRRRGGALVLCRRGASHRHCVGAPGHARRGRRPAAARAKVPRRVPHRCARRHARAARHLWLARSHLLRPRACKPRCARSPPARACANGRCISRCTQRRPACRPT